MKKLTSDEAIKLIGDFRHTLLADFNGRDWDNPEAETTIQLKAARLALFNALIQVEEEATELVKGRTYEIRYQGVHGYDGYSGKGIYTGETDDIDGPVYGFKITNAIGTYWFSREDVFAQH